MLIPQITFNEINVGNTPIRSNVRNRIGIVGQFSRGPANRFSFVDGFTDFSTLYGSDTTSGSIAYQAAYDQGAREFGIVRVLGNSKPAKGQVILGGVSTVSNTLNLNIVGLKRPVVSPDSFFINDIDNNGIYEGTQSGRYVFAVTGPTEIKYKFIPYSVERDDTEAFNLLTTAVLAAITTDPYDPLDNTTVEGEGVLTISAVATSVVVEKGLSIIVGKTGETLLLQEGNKFSVTAEAYNYEIDITEGQTAIDIGNNLISVLSGSDPLNSIVSQLEYIPNNVLGYNNTITFDFDNNIIKGADGNNYFYKFELEEVDASISVSNLTNTAFAGGVDGPRFATRSLYSFTGTKLIQFSAISQGQWGNNLSLSFKFLGGSKYEVIVTDNQGIDFNPAVSAESYIIDLTQQGSVDDNGFISAFNNSRLVRGFFVPKSLDPVSFNVNLLKELPVRLAPPNTAETDTAKPTHPRFYGPNVLQNVTLEAGFDGPVLTENDFVLAAKQLEGQQVNILIAPGIYTNSPLVQAELVSIAESSSEVDALKIAVLSASPNLRPNNAFKEITGINSNRAVCVAGWSTYGGQPNVKRFGLSPDALYAGVLASIGFSISPAAKTSSGPIFNITEVDTEFNTSNSSLQLYTDARLEVLYPDLNVGGFFFLNGRTTSSNPAWDRITIRRTYDVIRQDLRTGLMSYLSEPHTKLLRKQIETSINAYFQSLLRGNKIANYAPAICNESNNPPENYINGEVNVSISFLPLYAADYINITITRNTSQGLSINDF